MKRLRRNSDAVDRRFLDRAEIEAALDEVADLAKRSGVHVALAGGVALQAYGSKRFTVDVDIIASAHIRGLRPTEPLTFGGYSSVTSAGTVVDVMICNNEFEGAFDAALERAVKKRNIPLRIVRPEHLVVMKMIAGRGKDELDLAWLITSGTANIYKSRKIVSDLLGHYAAREFSNFATESIWLKSQGRE